ncbi:Beta-galactosidase [Cucumis melo var. makuwa]|uniref:Beta-galactosidase n=1 Tax=Cucumis melo var. makuwa TaxID=1194695 RepID=A0A5A7SM65_CUCMM|nr:Beta-galactosidase [Cucumis melo var. makuwa]TYK30398.1 Beta-galactosidase [Cucumis melo var. makuwa]
MQPLFSVQLPLKEGKYSANAMESPGPKQPPQPLPLPPPPTPPWKNYSNGFRRRRSIQLANPRRVHATFRPETTSRLPLSGAWAHAPPSINLTAHPIRFHALSFVQLSHPSDHPPPHAPPLYNSANLSSSANLFIDPLQQPFYRNEADQHHNRSGIEAGESSTSSGYGQPYVHGLGINQTYRRTVFEVSTSLAQTNLSMYSKNPCWKLHDRPPRGNKRSSNEQQNSGRTDVRETASTSQPISPTASQSSSPTLSAIAESSMSQSLGLISVDGTNPWILDSGATDRGFLGALCLLYPLCRKITHELHCKATFLPKSVCFQDLNSGRTIGTARHIRRRYILNDDTSDSSISTTSLLSSYFSTSEHDFMLWHFWQNNIVFLFPHNHINPHNRSPLSIVTFGVPPSEFLASKGIVHQNSCAYTPQQNGVAERKNQHLMEVARSLMLFTSLPSYLWGDAILTATYLINRMSSRILHLQTLLECLKESYPSTRLVSEVPLCVFGCTAYVHSFGPNQTKFTPRAQACAFVSHLQGESVSEESNSTFEFIEPTPSTVSDIDPHPIILPTNQVPWKTYYRRNLRKEVESLTSPVQDSKTPRDQGLMLLFLKKWKKRTVMMRLRSEQKPVTMKLNRVRKLDKYDPSLNLPIALRKGTRSCTKHSISNYVSYENLSPQFRAFTASLDSTRIPKNIHIALECPEWKNAVMKEMKALEKNNTWEIGALPKGHKHVGCKWVFTLKYKADGTLDRHKARLVAKGFTQTYGVDYSETFSPVVKLNTVRVLSLAVNKDWPLYHLDVKNVFLNGDLVEKVYMSPPPGFEAQFGQQSQGYSKGHSDHTLFTKVSKTGKIAVLIVYVDDIVLFGNDQAEISQLKQRMGNEFEIKNLGNLKYFLGMEVARSKEGISVSQRKYTIDLLTERGMLGCRPADTLIEFNYKLGNSDDQVPVDKEQYQRLVGKLIYLSHTRPDISFAVNAVSQFMRLPMRNTWKLSKEF